MWEKKLAKRKPPVTFKRKEKNPIRLKEITIGAILLKFLIQISGKNIVVKFADDKITR